MENELNRFESAVSATSSGNLTWERWPHDYALALGLAGQKNPLGFAVVRYLSDAPSSAAVWNVVLILATQLGKRGFNGPEVREMAWQAFDFWRDSRCRSCHGRGIMGIEQQMCMVCNGTGKRLAPDSPEILRQAVSCLIESEQWMEGQLRARLKGATYKPASEGYQVNLPTVSRGSDND